MAGKYDSILPTLKKQQPEDLTRQAKLDIIKQAMPTDARDLAREYIGLRAEDAELKQEASALGLRIEAVVQLLDASQDAGAEGWGEYGVASNALRLASGDTVRMQREPVGKVVDKEAFRLWCKAPANKCMMCGYPEEDLVHDEHSEGPGYHAYHPGGGYETKLQLWPSVMNAIVKERLLSGEAEPDGTEALSYVKAVLVKAGGKEEE